MDIERISHNGELLAVIIYSTYTADGLHFFTEDEDPLQVALIKHPPGKTIQAHVHNSVQRSIAYTTEVLVLRNGRVRVDFYTPARDFIESRILQKGDIVILFKGGHGFEVIDDLEMIEVKQGPYLGDHDKTKFDPR